MPRSTRLCRLLAASLLTAAPVAAGEARASGHREVVALLDGEPIYLDEVEPRAALEIFKLRGDLHRLMQNAVDEVVAERLLTREAARRGWTVEELLRREVDEKAPAPGPAEVDALLAREAEGQEITPSMRERAEHYLGERARLERRLAFEAELAAGARFESRLAPPEPVRARVDPADSPARGPLAAPLVAVHFTDFHCARCAQGARYLERLQAELPGQVRWVHRAALARPDEVALAAAELAARAGEAGRFWELHDRLFALGGAFGEAELAAVGRELGLLAPAPPGADEPGAVLALLAGQARPRLLADLASARRLGIRQAPAIFLNGRYFSPSFPYDQLAALARDELARLGAPPGGPPQTP